MSNNLNIKMRWLTMSLLILKTHLLVQGKNKEEQTQKKKEEKRKKVRKMKEYYTYIYASKSIIVSTRKRGIESRNMYFEGGMPAKSLSVVEKAKTLKIE